MNEIEQEKSKISSIRDKSPGSSGSNNYNKYVEDKLKEYTILNPYGVSSSQISTDNQNNLIKDKNSKSEINKQNFNLKQVNINDKNIRSDNRNLSNSDVDSLRTLEKRYIELMNRFNKVSNQFQSLKTTNEIIEKENKYQAELHKRVVFDLQNEIDNLNISLHEK